VKGLGSRVLSPSENGDGRSASGPSQILGGAQERMAGHLPLPGLSPELGPYFEYLGSPGSPDGMALALESARGIDGLGPVQTGLTILYRLVCLTGRKESQILDMQQFRNGETVVYLGKLDFLRCDAGHVKGFPGRIPGCFKGGQILGGVQTAPAGLPDSGNVKRLSALVFLAAMTSSSVGLSCSLGFRAALS